MVALTLAMMTNSGSTFHPLLIILFISGLYIYIIVSSCILSLHYVNSMNNIVRLSLGSVGGGD